MVSGRWEKVKSIFEAVLERPHDERADYVARLCGLDADLEAEVMALLDADHAMGAFMHTSIHHPSNQTQTDRWIPVGSVLAGRFQVVRFLGEGGMGQVYEGLDLELGEHVALKTIRPEIAADPRTIGMFIHEIQLARRVTHPNVCRIFDLEKDRTRDFSIVFLTMELLDGETLDDFLLRKGALDLPLALNLTQQVADALTAIHDCQLVHRDLKPGNVLLVNSGAKIRAVVTDFGLARPQVLATPSDPKVGSGTFSGAAGTPAYMAPEQVQGRTATAATDIYALGLVIYKMVTGRLPPIERSVNASDSVAAQPPRQQLAGVSSVEGTLARTPDAAVPLQLQKIIARCLEYAPERRYQHGSELRADIQRLGTDAQARSQSTPTPLAGPKNPNDATDGSILSRRHRTTAFISALVLLVAVIGIPLYYHSRPKIVPLTDKDTLVLGEFKNSTGERVFDETLKTALAVALRQSPFLDILSDNRVVSILKLMNRPVDTKLTPDVARELCLRANARAYVAGSIETLGNEYVVGLKAVDCSTGDTLGQEQITATTKELVLNAVGEGASRLRNQLGESADGTSRFNVPLEQATTSSLEALQAYSLARKVNAETENVQAALAYDRRATTLDPNFAMAYSALGSDYKYLGQIGRAREYYKKAYDLREHTSDREKLEISLLTYTSGYQDLADIIRLCQEAIASYPRDYLGYHILGIAYAAEGQYDKAADVGQQAIRLASYRGNVYLAQANYLLALHRFDNAERAIENAQSRKWDGFFIHAQLYGLGFLTSNPAKMAEQQQWFSANSDVRHFGLSLAADTEAYTGHLAQARKLTRQSAESAVQYDSKENAAVWLENAALREAAFGNFAEARQSAAAGLELAANSYGVEFEAALAFAMAGDVDRSGALVQQLGHSNSDPVDLQTGYAVIRAQSELSRHQAAAAISELEPLLPLRDYGQQSWVVYLSCAYPAYIRGQAYLAAGEGREAAGEFQKILDHSGVVWNCWTGALAHLGLARADALQAKNSQGSDAKRTRSRALAEYKIFIELWKEADPSIPIYQQAKSEYLKLQ